MEPHRLGHPPALNESTNSLAEWADYLMDSSTPEPLNCFTVYWVVLDPENKYGSESSNDDDIEFDTDPQWGAHGTDIGDFTASSPADACKMAAVLLGYPDAETFSIEESKGDFEVWLEAAPIY